MQHLDQTDRNARTRPQTRGRCSIRGWAASALAILLPATAAAVQETIDVLVVIVDFADVPAPPQLRYLKGSTSKTVSLDVSNAEVVFFTGPSSTSARYSDMSQGELSVAGDVVEVSIALNLATSTSSQWRGAADLEAVSQGYTLSNYDRFGYLLSSGFSGQSGTGGAAADWFWAGGAASSWINERTFNHELGHTLDLDHASEIQANGSVATYGDLTDFMGGGDAVHTNAVHKYRKGWLTGSRHLVHPLDASTTYLLRAIADPQDDLQVVSIDSHGAQPDLGVPIDTYLSFRAPMGIDQNLTTLDDSYGTPLRNTVHIHHGRKDGSFDTYLNRALEVGGIYTTQNTTIEVLSISAAGANVSVSQTPYTPSPPIVSVDPVGTDQVLAGVAVEYTVSVTNPDTGATFPAFYENSLTPPAADWIVSWDSFPMPIVVDPGVTEVISTLRVISPFAAPAGIYNVDLELANETGSSGPVSTIASFSYEVLPSPDTTPPPPPSGLFGNTFPGTGDDYVVLQWTPPPDVSDVSFYRPYRNGVALPAIGIPIAADFIYSALVTNAYVVRSVDAAGNESTPSSSLVVGAPDVEPPSAVGSLSGSVVENQVVLTWSAATDNTWVEHYEIHRNGMLYATTGEPTFTDTAPPIDASYTVYAVDASGNISTVSTSWLLVSLPALSLPGAAALAAMLWLAARRALRPAVKQK